MKATGIVRRVEEYGIIGQKSKRRIQYRFVDFRLGSICAHPEQKGPFKPLKRGVQLHNKEPDES